MARSFFYFFFAWLGQLHPLYHFTTKTKQNENDCMAIIVSWYHEITIETLRSDTSWRNYTIRTFLGDGGLSTKIHDLHEGYLSIMLGSHEHLAVAILIGGDFDVPWIFPGFPLRHVLFPPSLPYELKAAFVLPEPASIAWRKATRTWEKSHWLRAENGCCWGLVNTPKSEVFTDLRKGFAKHSKCCNNSPALPSIAESYFTSKMSCFFVYSGLLESVQRRNVWLMISKQCSYVIHSSCRHLSNASQRVDLGASRTFKHPALVSAFRKPHRYGHST